MNSRSLGAIALAMTMVGFSLPASAAEDTAALTLTLENDILTSSDNNYTNGFGVSWVSNDLQSYGEDGFLGRWNEFWSFLPFADDEGYRTYAAWTLAQEMNTPDDITNPNPPLEDQPYSGILYVDSILYARRGRWAHAWELKLGVVGPASQADDTQKNVHDWIGDDEPMGWDTQLPNEPVVNISYTAAYLAAQGHVGRGAAQWRVVPVGNVGLGTYFTGAGVGAYGEVGWNLVDALGGSSLRTGLNAASTAGASPVNDWSVSFFGGGGVYGVAHYLPLDGTVFRDSRSVDSEPFVGTASLGVNVRHKKLVMSLGASFFGARTDGENQDTEYGTFSISWGY